MGLGYIRKLAEHEPVSEPKNRLTNGFPPGFLFQFLLEFLPSHPSVIDCDLEV